MLPAGPGPAAEEVSLSVENAGTREAGTAASGGKPCREDICFASELIYYSVNRHLLKPSSVSGADVSSGAKNSPGIALGGLKSRGREKLVLQMEMM